VQPGGELGALFKRELFDCAFDFRQAHEVNLAIAFFSSNLFKQNSRALSSSAVC
jgi:hypothetical protein